MEMKPKCEQCGRELPHDSGIAMICSYERTYCLPCAEGDLHGNCPRCGMELTRRPRRIKRAEKTR
jgi:uncharacterized protein